MATTPAADYIMPRQEDMHVHVCACGQMATTRFMTGKEWYERLVEQLNKDMASNPTVKTTDDPLIIVKAAQKVAGLL